MLTSIRIQGYRCLRDVLIEDIQPLHALIGPNDSGKSSVLQATELATSYLRGHGIQSNLPSGFGVEVQAGPWRGGFDASGTRFPDRPNHLEAIQHIPQPQAIHWSAGLLREPVEPWISGSGDPAFSSGHAPIASVLDKWLKSDRARFFAIEQRFIALFPIVRDVFIGNPTNNSVSWGVHLHGVEEPVDASALSEGLLFYMAYEVLASLSGPRLFLVEEPESGLHPARIRDVVRVLRRLTSEGHQVILTTHSPIVLDELEPQEITVLDRDVARGTVATPLSKTAGFDMREGIYSPGEMWLALIDDALAADPNAPVAAEP